MPQAVRKAGRGSGRSPAADSATGLVLTAAGCSFPVLPRQRRRSHVPCTIYHTWYWYTIPGTGMSYHTPRKDPRDVAKQNEGNRQHSTSTPTSDADTTNTPPTPTPRTPTPRTPTCVIRHGTNKRPYCCIVAVIKEISHVLLRRSCWGEGPHEREIPHANLF